MKEIKIWRSNRSLSADLGEWYIKHLFGLDFPSTQTNSKGDLLSKDDRYHYEVKTVRRAATNTAKRVDIRKQQLESISHIVIVRLFDDYIIKEIFLFQQKEIYELVKKDKKDIFSIEPDRFPSHKIKNKSQIIVKSEISDYIKSNLWRD